MAKIQKNYRLDSMTLELIDELVTIRQKQLDDLNLRINVTATMILEEAIHQYYLSQKKVNESTNFMN